VEVFMNPSPTTKEIEAKKSILNLQIDLHGPFVNYWNSTILPIQLKFHMPCQFAIVATTTCKKNKGKKIVNRL
jgi:hypothetical protein